MSVDLGFSKSMMPPSARWMGMDVVEHRAEYNFTKVTFDPPADMKNFGGVVQGGFISAMLDDAMGLNCFLALEMKTAQATIDLHTQFFKAVPLGPTTVEARVVRVGKTVAFLEATLYDMDGELAARATSSTKLRPFTNWQQASGEPT